jgi:Uma2 family endonuclease
MSESVLRPAGGLYAADLDNRPDLHPRTELIDGGLVHTSPQQLFHMLAVTVLAQGLRGDCPPDVRVREFMSVTLTPRTRVVPDMVLVLAASESTTAMTGYAAADVRLVVEVVSPESQVRDRERKPELYAHAGVRHFWRVEEESGQPVVHVYELDPATKSYGLVGIYHDRLKLTLPHHIDIDLTVIDSL